MAADERGVIHVLWEYDVTGHLAMTVKVTDVDPTGEVVTTLVEDRHGGGYGDLDVLPTARRAPCGSVSGGTGGCCQTSTARAPPQR